MKEQKATKNLYKKGRKGSGVAGQKQHLSNQRKDTTRPDEDNQEDKDFLLPTSRFEVGGVEPEFLV